MQDLNAFEQKIQKALGKGTPNAGFKAGLAREIRLAESKPAAVPFRFFGLNRAWAYALSALAVLVIAVYAVGPSKVLAQIGAIFGYVPGAGVVDVSSPMRILAEPVSVTKDGVTLTVKSAFLNENESLIPQPDVSGLAPDAKIKDFNAPFCGGGSETMPYLTLPDGSRVDVHGTGYQPVPAGVYDVTLHVPCIPFTLTGKAPVNWEIPLKFIDAPADMAVYPVEEVAPESQFVVTNPDETLASQPLVSLSVTKYVELPDSYAVVLAVPETASWDHAAMPFNSLDPLVITDAAGKEIPYRWPADGESLIRDEVGKGITFIWALEIPKDTAFPVRFDLPMTALNYPVPIDASPIVFDPGLNPQLGQVWLVNHILNLGEEQVKLVSVDIDPMTKYGLGYRFNFEGKASIYNFELNLEGYKDPVRNWTEDKNANTFSLSLIYEGQPLPKGPQTLHIRYLPPPVEGERIQLAATWSPKE